MLIAYSSSSAWLGASGSECRIELLQIQFGSLAQIADGLGHRLALSRGAGLGVEGDEAALLGWNQNGSEKHESSLWKTARESSRAQASELAPLGW